MIALYRFILLTIAVATASLFVLLSTTNELHSSSLRNRRLRFFDSHHRNCADSDIQHWFSVHCVYGATTNIFPDYYKNQRTITTDRDLDPTNKEAVDHILRVLSPIARKHERAFRVRIPAFLSYWGDFFVDDARDHLQPYTIVNAEELKEVGVDVVEMKYWVKADGVRRIAKQPEHTEKLINIGSGEAAVAALKSVAARTREKADELVFSLDELIALDSVTVGALAGEEGGFVDGSWRRTFICEELTEAPIINI